MMSPLNLLSLIKGYEGAFMTIGGAVLGWWGQIAKNRLQRQRNEIDANGLDNEQLKLALERERFLTDRLNLFDAGYAMLWERLYDRENVIKDYHSAALSAQRHVHELEIRLDVPLTPFPALPEFPPDDATSWGAQNALKPHDVDPRDNIHAQNPNPTSSTMNEQEAPTHPKDHYTAKTH